MSEHTPGKLTLSEDGLPELNNQNQIIESTSGDLIVYHRFKNKADARRLVAAWNACEGLDTELMENIVMTGDTIKGRFDLRTKEERAMASEADSLRAVNAELLEALEGLVEAEKSMRATYTCEYGKTSEDEDHFGHEKWAGEFLLERADAARAAIASARKLKGKEA